MKTVPLLQASALMHLTQRLKGSETQRKREEKKTEEERGVGKKEKKERKE